MKKTFFICGLLLLICGKSGSTIIENPVYEVRNSGIRKIVKVELNKHETRIHIHCPLGMAEFSPASTDAQGHLLKDNFRMDRFEEELDKILDKEKKETNADKK